jgi:hypothetical protein
VPVGARHRLALFPQATLLRQGDAMHRPYKKENVQGDAMHCPYKKGNVQGDALRRPTNETDCVQR